MILSSLQAALSQLGDPRFRAVLLRGLGITLVALFLFGWLFVTGIGWLVPDSLSLPWIGEITWVDNAASVAGAVLILGLSVFLMVPVASAVTGFFLEEVAEAVEEVHYPASRAGQAGLGESLRDAIGFLGLLIVANLAALVLYLFFIPFAPLIFWGMNGLLLGREYFQMVAMRHLGRQGATAMRRRHRGTIWITGVLMAIPLTVPLLNLLVPIVGAATFTHLYHRLSAAEAR